jgi:hypothetical protein
MQGTALRKIIQYWLYTGLVTTDIKIESYGKNKKSKSIPVTGRGDP